MPRPDDPRIQGSHELKLSAEKQLGRPLPPSATEEVLASLPPIATSAGTLHTAAARTGRLACRESNFLHHTQLRTDDVPAESTADPEEAFSGRRSS